MSVYESKTTRDSSIPTPVQGLACYNEALVSHQIYDGAGFWRTPNRHIAHDFDEELSNIVAYWDASRGTDIAADNADVASWTDRVGAYAVTEGMNHPRLDVDGGPNGSRALAFLRTSSEKLSSSDPAFDDLPEVSWGGWIYWSGDATAGHAGILSQNSTTRRLEIDTSNGSLLGTLEAATTNGQSQSAAGVIAANTWTHVAMSAHAIGSRHFATGANDQFLQSTSATAFGASDGAMCCWFKMDESPATQTIFYCGTGTGVSLYYMADEKVRAYYGVGDGASSQYLESPGTYALGTWHFAVINIDRDGLLSLYVNDMTTPVNTVDISAESGKDYSTQVLQISGATTANRIDGSVSRAGKVVGSLLTQSQRAELYDGAPRYRDLSSSLQSTFNHFYDCVRISGNEPDLVGSADLTDYNGATNDERPTKDRKPTLYVNGSEVSYASQTDADGALDSDSGDLQIGYSRAASDYFDGRVSSIMVLDERLSDELLGAMYKATRNQGAGQ